MLNGFVLVVKAGCEILLVFVITLLTCTSQDDVSWETISWLKIQVISFVSSSNNFPMLHLTINPVLVVS